MNFINYLSERPKLTQFGIVLIVFFILMSMTGLYHDLIVERHLFAKSVVKGEIQSSVGFAESMSMILNWQLRPRSATCGGGVTSSGFVCLRSHRTSPPHQP